MAIRFATSRWTSSSTALVGQLEVEQRARERARGGQHRVLCAGSTFSSHQRATSGNESSRSVSPVGAQSTMTTSQSPDVGCALELQQA